MAYVADSPTRPRVTPLDFGFHEATHATAFGKIMLAGMMPEQRDQFLLGHPLTPLTRHTMTDRVELESTSGHGRSGRPRLGARGIHAGSGLCRGGRPRRGRGRRRFHRVSGSVSQMRRRAASCESSVRHSAAELSRYFRSGPARSTLD